MRKLVIPTVFAKNKGDFIERFNKLVKIAKYIHIDFMDGKFVKTRGIKIGDIPNLKKYRNNFEAHLMVKKPRKYIISAKNKGFKKIIFHYEACKNNKDIGEIINKIKSKRMEAWIALNPETSSAGLRPYINKVDGIMLMGVHPGKEHQNFISSVYKKIEKLRKIEEKIKIQIDGGVSMNNIKKLNRLGVNFDNSGSFIAEAKNPKVAMEKLEKAINS